jgi:cytoskeletal protein RodZ
MNITTEQGTGWGWGEENVIKATYTMKTMKQTCKIKKQKKMKRGSIEKNTALIKLVVHILVLLYNKWEAMLINRTNRSNSKTVSSVEG